VLFKLLRGVTEFPQFTYVCAFDRNALVDTLRGNDKNQSREKVGHFLEKFFPDDIPLPKIDEAHLAAELEKRFYAICDRNDLIADPAERQQFKDQFRSLWATTLKGYFSNLRRVKLFTNRLTRSLPLVGAEVNLMDFVLLEIVRMMKPVLYEEIFRDARYFMFPQWRFITWLQVVSPDDKDAQRRRVSYFDELFRGLARPPEGIALALLKEIFPTVDAYLAGGDIPGSIANDQEKALLQRRIYHPEFFPRYFLFSVPSDLFGEKELTDFIAAMNDKKDVAQCVSVFKAKYGELQELPMKRWDFLSHVRTSLKRFSTAPKHALPVAISHLSAQLEEAEAAGSFDAMTGIRIVFGAINQLDGTVDAQILLEETIRDAASDFFATRVLNESIARTNRLLKHEIVLDKHALEKTFCDRMTKRYELGGALSFFPKEGRPDIAPLGRWALCGADGQEQVHRYLRREFVSAHWKIGRFLSYFFPRPDDVYPGIDSLKAIEVYFPAQELRSLLGEYGDSSASSPEESRAIHDFRTQYPSGP
jgi:hypothetical protein